MTAIVTPAKTLDAEARYRALFTDPRLVHGGRIEPVWLGPDLAFVEQGEAAPVLKVVTRATGQVRLRRPVAELIGGDPGPGPIGLHAGPAGGLLLTVGPRTFAVSPEDGAAGGLSEDEAAELARLSPQVTRPGYPTVFPPEMEAVSPDRTLAVTLRDHDVWLRPTGEGEARRITFDAVADPRWSTVNAVWSADSRRLALTRIDEREVYRVPLVDWTGEARKVDWHTYPRADGAIAVIQVHLVDVATGQVTPVGGGDEGHYAYIQGFSADGRTLRFARMERTSKEVEVFAYDIESGETRLLLREEAGTFLYWPPTFIRGGAPMRMLADGRFLWFSECSGWNQIHLHEADGRLARVLTAGHYPVTDIAGVDEAEGTVFYRAQPDPERPYDAQLFRVGLAGGEPVQLSSATGVHEIALAPDGAHYVDIHSALDRPPQAELHAADGTLIAVLSRADISGLKGLGWIAPEPFRAKAADGETDIFGVLFKPYDFDPARKYPVIEQIYAGPQSTLAPHAFGTVPAAAFAQLGYILVIVDARGTPLRGKAFQDVAVGGMGDYEVADHAGAIRQAAATRPYMDLSRVGIFGGSYGGYFTIRALIQAPELYRAAVSLAPAELGPSIMGPPIECYAGLPADHPEHYERLRNTDKLDGVRGDLLIISAADDVNTPLEHTMLYAEALIRLKRPFDQVVMPGCNHVLINARGEPQLEFMYAAMMRHFARTLHPGT